MTLVLLATIGKFSGFPRLIGGTASAAAPMTRKTGAGFLFSGLVERFLRMVKFFPRLKVCRGAS